VVLDGKIRLSTAKNWIRTEKLDGVSRMNILLRSGVSFPQDGERFATQETAGPTVAEFTPLPGRVTNPGC